ncbi:Uridine nucleosidase 1 [Orbilia oligospora]|uniref:Uridine nucleosidase 1 n=1 Tax=Orbilia oligospora TaxID=2813651 RepID=A0A6G1MGG6_ORBOL|nr:Uridine nucleosidase 1 [Orbilia oligospora]KAF3200029.1 Uridine nucleosidase 1 [Orbilia oligospora]KAF3206344.1 Uridine nucleosidase 1 [Orbilia oligospora]KAF3212506.1 Uridine nucleosidase 1 [Orbilia oligospora]KAF3258181.1 Uridine nucleosidase 1 [Orbilia oligospora]
MAPERIPVWLDCDPGHDDAFAILITALHPSFDLLGISTIHGNSSLQKVTNNALSILTAIGRPDVPVYPGANKPFMRPAVHAPDIHGDTGIDGTTLLPTPTRKPQTVPAVEAMRKAIMSTKRGTCTLVVTGTMTNAALLFAAFPETAEHIKTISIMGGAFTLGNITKSAEFNIYCDPESAASIFTLPSLSNKIILSPLDLTHTVLVTTSVRQTLTSTPSTFRTMLYELLMFFAETYIRVFDMTEGPPLHDPIAVAALMDESFGMEFEYLETGIKVICNGEEMGRTVMVGVDEGVMEHEGKQVLGDCGVGGGGVKVKVGRKLNVDRFWEVVMGVVEKADKMSPLNM